MLQHKNAWSVVNQRTDIVSKLRSLLFQGRFAFDLDTDRCLSLWTDIDDELKPKQKFSRPLEMLYVPITFPT